jgi:hypothetical protein
VSAQIQRFPLSADERGWERMNADRSEAWIDQQKKSASIRDDPRSSALKSSAQEPIDA